MLTLLLALVTTPAGISAVVAIGLAVLALLYAPRLALPVALVAVILLGVAYVSRLQADLASTQRQRDEAAALAEVRKGAVEALQRNAKAAAKRSAATASAHDRIRRAPASDDGPLAPVLRDALEAGQ
ncbi:hypothetical protein MKK58_17705 [Methylobacterium sp. J-078]|uniref:hypothetical protein n=1 Tax=Methylobacterium sp. J-078 TaxID=2836657 RepID=UPI001FB87039|nr:hypothetical protein [Methylobacterium sp. J-078]MCJ2046354.1 hypothetical protein [Methylobacterium sp. J-078]